VSGLERNEEDFVMKKRTIICISREYGSGGRVTGEKLSELLGIPCYDKSLLALTAREHGVEEETIATNDEKPVTWTSMGFPRGIRNPYKIPLELNSSYVINDVVFQMLTETIQNLAREGSCIIIGRAAKEALKNDPDMISVFIHAKLDDRIKQIMNQEHFDEKQARQMIREMDKKRAEFINMYSKDKWAACSSYDLSISTSRFGIDGAVKAIMSLLE
jgi:CMP/dCMP kinase